MLSIKMKCIILLGVLGIAVASVSHLEQRDPDQDWENFKKKYNKRYEAEEEHRRRFIWKHHRSHIDKHNAEAEQGIHTYTLGENEYADMSNHEFRHIMNGYLRRTVPSFKQELEEVEVDGLPKTVDWRKKGYVTPVKNQEQCGSCWAFSTTGSLEGQHFKKTGKLVSLSEQNLVDCSGPEGNMGCEGGLMDQAFKYIKINKGIDTEASYPYKAEDEKCEYNKNTIGATLTSWVDVPSGSEKALKKAVATVGPVSVAIDAGNLSFQLYKNGVYNEPHCSQTLLDHGVLAVGYGTHNSQDYWLVKNSWGTSWGMNGYIMMSRNKNNQCGIATQASYPVV